MPSDPFHVGIQTVLEQATGMGLAVVPWSPHQAWLDDWLAMGVLMNSSGIAIENQVECHRWCHELIAKTGYKNHGMNDNLESWAFLTLVYSSFSLKLPSQLLLIFKSIKLTD